MFLVKRTFFMFPASEFLLLVVAEVKISLLFSLLTCLTLQFGFTHFLTFW